MEADKLVESVKFLLRSVRDLSDRFVESNQGISNTFTSVYSDIRGIQDACGITNEDIAKRLIDFGFHAPTMSFPVAGTLMIEPTESESLAEIDRFCDAMLSIADEIENVKSGQWPANNNPLVNAPHTAESLLGDDWTHPYSRQLAANPRGNSQANKYWPPVGRVDNAFGDRNLICSCPSVEEWEAAAE